MEKLLLWKYVMCLILSWSPSLKNSLNLGIISIFLMNFYCPLSWGILKISGTLYEKGTKKTIKEANIFLLPLKLKTTTSVSGEFNFEVDDTNLNDIEIVVNLTNYNKLIQKFSINDKSDMTLKLYLEKNSYHNSEGLYETTVNSKIKKRDDQTHTLNANDFLTMPGTFGGDPVRATQNLPGVAQVGASAEVVIQGGSPEETKYLIDEHRVPNVFHFGGLSSVVSPESVGQVELVPSGYGPEYSGALGGLVKLKTKDEVPEKFRGLVFVDLLNSGALVTGPIGEEKKSSYLVGARYSYIGEVLKLIAKSSDEVKLTAAPVYYDLTGIYKNKFSEQHQFKTTLIMSRDELQLILNRAVSDDPALKGSFQYTTHFVRVIPSLTTKLPNDAEMIHSLGIGYNSIFFNVGGDYLDIFSKVITHRSEYNQKISPLYHYYVGLDNEFSDDLVKINLPSNYESGGVENPYSSGEKKKFVTEEVDLEWGAYLRNEIKLSGESPWTFLPSLRFDHYKETSETIFTPRLQLRYQYDESVLLRAAGGEYVQLPRPQETSGLYGNPNLMSPRSFHYTLGWGKDFRGGSSRGLEVTNNFFYKRLYRMVINDVEKIYSNNGTGKIYGMEWLVKLKNEEWTGQMVYTLLKSLRSTPTYKNKPSQYDQTHNLNFILSYQVNNWLYSTRFRLVTGNPYTPVVGSVFDSDNDVFLPTRGDIYSQRFDLFNQLDIRIERKFIYDEWILTAYLDIQNVMNQENSSNIQYSYDYKESEKIRGLPIAPTFGVKGEF
jgi:hypothetical protein